MEKDSIGVKQRDIQKCAGCGEGVMHDNMLAFYIVRADYMIVDIGAMQRQHGLEMMMGKAAAFAQHIGPDEDMAKQVSSTKIWVCVECAIRKPLVDLIEGQSEDLGRLVPPHGSGP